MITLKEAMAAARAALTPNEPVCFNLELWHHSHSELGSPLFKFWDGTHHHKGATLEEALQKFLDFHSPKQVPSVTQAVAVVAEASLLTPPEPFPAPVAAEAGDDCLF